MASLSSEWKGSFFRDYLLPVALPSQTVAQPPSHYFPQQEGTCISVQLEQCSLILMRVLKIFAVQYKGTQGLLVATSFLYS